MTLLSLKQRLSEISRVLKSGGCFMEITYGSPKTRLGYLDNAEYNWTIAQYTVGKFCKLSSLLLCALMKLPSDKPTVALDDKKHKEKDVHYVYCMTKK
jgi:hypothetical protein